MLEVRVERVARRHCKVRQVVVGRAQVELAAFGNGDRVPQCVREIAKDGGHLVGRLQKELVPVIAQTLRVLHVLAGPDAQQDVVGAMVGLPQVVHIVGADHRDVERLGDRRQPTVDDALLVDPLELHFEKEVSRA